MTEPTSYGQRPWSMQKGATAPGRRPDVLRHPHRPREAALFAALALACAPLRAEAEPASSTRTATAARPPVAPEDQRLADAAAALARGEPQQAVDLTEGAGGLLDDYRALLRGRALVALGQKDRALAALEAVKPLPTRCAKAPAADHPLYADAVHERARILAETDPVAAADLLGLLRPTPELWSEALELYRRADERGRAEALEAKLLLEVPESLEARTLAEQLKAAGIAKRLPTTEQRLTRVRRLLDGHQNAMARDEAAELAKAVGEESPFQCELSFILGKAERKLRSYQASQDDLVRARERCTKEKNDDVALRAALLEVQVRAVTGDAKDVKAVVDWMRKKHPGHSYLDDALIFLAGMYGPKGEKAAKALWTEIADQMPDSDSVSEALWRLGYLAIRAKDEKTAAKRLEQLLARRDVTWPERGRARYWLARVLETSSPARARALDEENVLDLSFYGWLTLAHLDETDPKRAAELKAKLTSVRDAEPGTPPPAPATIVGTDEHQRALRLHALGAQVYAEGELERLACSGISDDEALALALSFDAVEAHRRAQEILRARAATMLEGPITPDSLRTWRAAYSRPYFAALERAASESKVEPLFFLALVREESVFDPAVISWAGAIGLSQLMPGTAVLAGRALKLGKIDPDRLTDPELNLRLGARVLRDGLKDFGDREPLALVAYNGGPGVARRLVDPKSSKPFDRWVEDIGIKETRGYVKRVLGTWGIYRFLYDRDRPFIGLPVSIGGTPDT